MNLRKRGKDVKSVKLISLPLSFSLFPDGIATKAYGNYDDNSYSRKGNRNKGCYEGITGGSAGDKRGAKQATDVIGDKRTKYRLNKNSSNIQLIASL